MKDKNKVVKKAHGKGKEKGKKVTYTCVCDMEWRGTHFDEWGDCVCYPDEQDKDKTEH